MVVFINSFSGKSKTSGKDFTRYTFVQGEMKEGKLQGRTYDYFVDKPLPNSDFHFGDVVKVKFENGEMMASRPRLVGIERVSESPFLNSDEFKS